jgi:hypothetical protein
MAGFDANRIYLDALAKLEDRHKEWTAAGVPYVAATRREKIHDYSVVGDIDDDANPKPKMDGSVHIVIIKGYTYLGAGGGDAAVADRYPQKVTVYRRDSGASDITVAWVLTSHEKVVVKQYYHTPVELRQVSFAFADFEQLGHAMRGLRTGPDHTSYMTQHYPAVPFVTETFRDGVLAAADSTDDSYTFQVLGDNRTATRVVTHKSLKVSDNLVLDERRRLPLGREDPGMSDKINGTASATSTTRLDREGLRAVYEDTDGRAPAFKVEIGEHLLAVEHWATTSYFTCGLHYLISAETAAEASTPPAALPAPQGDTGGDRVAVRYVSGWRGGGAGTGAGVGAGTGAGVDLDASFGLMDDIGEDTLGPPGGEM